MTIIGTRTTEILSCMRLHVFEPCSDWRLRLTTSILLAVFVLGSAGTRSVNMQAIVRAAYAAVACYIPMLEL